MNTKLQNFVLPVTEHLWDNQYKNNFNIFALLKKNLFTKGQKGCVEFIYEGIFGKHSKKKFWFWNFWNSKIEIENCDALFRPSTLKTEDFFLNILRVGYVYIEESFDTIFDMVYGGGRRGVQRPHPMDYWSGKSPMG